MKKTMRFILLIMIMTTALSVLSGCRQSTSKGNANELDNGVSAIEDAMSNGRDSSQQTETDAVTDLRNGTSADTVATPDDFPNTYDYGSGKMQISTELIRMRLLLWNFQQEVFRQENS